MGLCSSATLLSKAVEVSFVSLGSSVVEGTKKVSLGWVGPVEGVGLIRA